jgi:hypothetical protein
MFTHMRIAKPVANLERSFLMYSKGLGLHKIAEFNDHDGFNGIMLGRRLRLAHRIHFLPKPSRSTFTHRRGFTRCLLL